MSKSCAFSAKKQDRFVEVGVEPELLLGGFFEQGTDVYLDAEGKRVEQAVHTAAVSGSQVERARQVVVDSKVDPIISGEAYAPFHRA